MYVNREWDRNKVIMGLATTGAPGDNYLVQSEQMHFENDLSGVGSGQKEEKKNRLTFFGTSSASEVLDYLGTHSFFENKERHVSTRAAPKGANPPSAPRKVIDYGAVDVKVR